MTNSMIGVEAPIRTWLSNVCPMPWTLSLPGGIRGPITSAAIGLRAMLRPSQIQSTRFPCDVLLRLVSATAISLDDVQEPVHVADRLHRPAEPELEAGRAGDEALPAVLALLAGPEGERDRPVRHRLRVARREAALVLRVVGHALERDDHAELRDREGVRGVVRLDLLEGLAVERGRADDSLGAREERIPQPAVAVELVDGD